MFRSQTALAGFNPSTAPVASLRLTKAVAVSLMLAGLLLCCCVGLTLTTSVATLASPLAH